MLEKEATENSRKRNEDNIITAGQAIVNFVAEIKYELMPSVHHSDDDNDFTDDSEIEDIHILADQALLLSDAIAALTP